MRIGLALVLALSLAPASVEAMPLRTKLALGCFVTGSYWDAINTAHCSALGICHEANPLYRPFVARRRHCADYDHQGWRKHGDCGRRHQGQPTSPHASLLDGDKPVRRANRREHSER